MCLIFIIGIICYLLGDTYNYDLLYFIIFFPLVALAWNFAEWTRKDYILKKIKNGTLKLEQECEFAIYVLMELVRESLGDTLFAK